MNPSELLRIARHLATGGVGTGRGRPRQAELRRAVSAAYYALFHALATSNANTLIGASAELRALPAWTQTYRALDHRLAKSQITRGLAGFAVEIQTFGRTFSAIQELRRRADYDPDASFTRAATIFTIDRAEAAIRDFEAASRTQRSAFAAHVLFRVRTP